MNDFRPTSPANVDRLVRASLVRSATRVDSTVLLRGVESRLARHAQGDSPNRLAGGRQPCKWQRCAHWLTGLAVAACILLGAWLGLLHDPDESWARSLLVAVSQQLSADDDRCYDVQLRKPAEAAESFPFVAAQGDTRMWTRGDAFCVRNQKQGQTWWWGRDPEGRIWLAPSPQCGLVFDMAELPPTVRVAARVMQMRLDTLVQNMMVDYELSNESERESDRERLHATLKRPLPGKRLVEIELIVHSETKLIHSATLTWDYRDQPVGPARFTLVASQPPSDDWYGLPAHLDPDCQLHGPDQPEQRKEVLQQFFHELKQHQ